MKRRFGSVAALPVLAVLRALFRGVMLRGPGDNRDHASDNLDGFGPPMRYLQTVCGAPQHPGGAHWFPDTIVVTVPFRQPA
jgi:hypothetical protein